MKKQTIIIQTLAIGTLVIMITSQPAEAFSWTFTYGNYHPKHHHGHYKHKKHRKQYKKHKRNRRHKHYYKDYSYYHPHAKATWRLPRGSISFRIGGSRYHYHDGYYYKKARFGYQYVTAPIGACVPHLPYNHDVIYIDGHKYYLYDDVYYKHTHEGYVVIENPEYHHHAKHKGKKHKKKKKDKWHTPAEATITINIPNNDGSFTKVTLTRSNGGFYGPQGEFYEEFPQISKLRVIYGD